MSMPEGGGPSPFQVALTWLRERRKLSTYVVLYVLGWVTMAGYFDPAAFGFDFDAQLTMKDAISGIAGIVGAYLLERIPNQPPASDGQPPNGSDTLRSPAVSVGAALALALVLVGCVSTGSDNPADRSLRGTMATLAEGSAEFNQAGIDAIFADQLTAGQMASAVRASNTIRISLDQCLPTTLRFETGEVSRSDAVTCGLPAAVAIASIADLVTAEPDGVQLPYFSVLRTAARLALLPSPDMVALQQAIRAAEARRALLSIEIVEGAFANMRSTNDDLRSLVAARLAAVGALAALPAR